MTSIVDAPEYLFTSESVTEGHPDKLCDQVSDAILDAIIRDDPDARVACETATTTGLVIVLGEITTTTYVDFQQVVRETVREIGYTRTDYGFDYETCGTLISIKEQSTDIAQGVNAALETRGEEVDVGELGAGDQGMMFGFACRETPGAHAAADRAGPPHGPPPCRGAQVGPAAVPPAGRQDPGDGRVLERRAEASGPSSSRRSTIRTSASTALQDDLTEAVILPSIPRELRDHGPDHARQPDRPVRRRRADGRRRRDGPQDHRRLVRRDGPPRRRRLLGQGPDEGRPLRRLCRALGRQERGRGGPRGSLRGRGRVRDRDRQPLSLSIETFGTGKLPDEEILALIKRHFDLRPASIIAALDLRRPIYRQTAAYGHFGRLDLDLPWERTDKAELLAAEAGIRMPEAVPAA